MEIKRSEIKAQAKSLIKGNVLKLFLVMFVVYILTGAVSGVFSMSSGLPSLPSLDDFKSAEPSRDYSSVEDFDNFTDLDDIDDLDEFELDEDDNVIGGADTPAVSPVRATAASVGSGIGGLVTLALSPLYVMLIGVFLFLIRGQSLSVGDEFTYVFKNTFSKNYINLLLHQFLKGLFLTLLSFLFIIPGIIFYYKWYFSAYILAENPEMNWKDAMDLSKKMTKGHMGELFILDLSFILWGFLAVITLGIAGIYVAPYVQTVKVLYYENFKQRGFMNGELNPAEFAKTQTVPVYEPQTFNQPQGNVYQQPVQPQENVYQQPVQPQENIYQQPAQPQSFAQPTESAPTVEQPAINEQNGDNSEFYKPEE